MRWLCADEEVCLDDDEFAKQVIGRSNGRCAFCGADAQLACCILDERLFSDGGQYLSNGIAVCHHHRTLLQNGCISVEEARDAAHIMAATLPQNFDAMATYDRWGNLVLGDGALEAGPLADRQDCVSGLMASGLLDRLQSTGSWHLR